MPSRIIFANQLRGIAALLVVWLHLGMHYWSGGIFISNFLGAHPSQSPPVSKPIWAKAAEKLATLGTSGPIIDYGALGVALFFLISGFVIPFSLQRLSQGQFALNRILRIFPTYWGALVIALIFWQLPVILLNAPGNPDLSINRIAVQALLVFDLVGKSPLDLVTWSIIIELKFYLLAAILGKSFITGNIKAIATFTLVVFCVSFLINHQLFWNWFIQNFGWTPIALSNQIFGQFAFICYIFVGTAFHFHWQKQLTTIQLAIWAFVFWLACSIGLLSAGAPSSTVELINRNQFLALLIFGAAYSLRDRFRPNRILDFLADISYPWYCTHLIVGWTTLWLLGAFYGFHRGAIYFCIAFLTTIIIAWLLHRLIEQPCLRFSKSLFKATKTISH